MRRLVVSLSGTVALGLLLLWPASGQAKGSKGKDCVHTVASGQTLGHIANKHGVSQRDLIETDAALKNNPNLLRVGQELDICAARERAEARSSASTRGSKGSGNRSSSRGKACGSGGRIVEHEVQKGDTLSKITRRYAVTDKEVFRRNAALKADPNSLRVGQKVKVCVDELRVHASKTCGFRTPIFKHKVVPGENLGQIAGRYGVRRSDLQRWNSRIRKNPNLLSVGQTVRVCPEIAPRERKEIAYTVQSGDSLGEIAERYGLTLRELERFQRGKVDRASHLRVGQRLSVWVDGKIVDGFTRDRDKGVLRGGVQLPPGRHYHIKWEAGAWGTVSSIRSIQTAISAYKKRMPGGPKVHVGDISKRSGGKFPPHASHQHGRDVDVGYVLKGEHADQTRFRAANKQNLDIPRTWRLIKSFIDTDEVVYVFVDYKLQKLLYEYARDKRGASEELLDELFQYPRGRRRSHGLIRHWKGHINHFHVRFRE